MARVQQGDHTDLPATHTRTIPAFTPQPQVSPPFDWYSSRLPSKGWPDWVDLGGWLHSEINVLPHELNLDTVTSPSTNRAQRRLTSLSETNALPLHQTTTGKSQGLLNYRVRQKLDHFQKFITPVYNDVERRSIYENVQLFIMKKAGTLNAAIFKHSLHKFPETILHQKYRVIWASRSLNVGLLLKK